MLCPSCNQTLFVKSSGGSKYRSRRTIVILHRTGEVEINCPLCKHAVILGCLDKLAMRVAPTLRSAALDSGAR